MPTLNMTKDHELVMQALRHCQGEAAAVNQYALAESVGILRKRPISPRKVRMLIQDLRTLGHEPIAVRYGSEGGYYLATTQQERVATARALYGHALSTLRTMAAFDRATAKKLLGQLEMEI